VDGDGDDALQARDFLRRTNLKMLGETVDVPTLDRARRVGHRGLQAARRRCAAVNLQLLAEIRARYPVAAAREATGATESQATIEGSNQRVDRRNNRMLYQEGWGGVKHSSYSGGFSPAASRVRLRARAGSGFSPYAAVDDRGGGGDPVRGADAGIAHGGCMPSRVRSSRAECGVLGVEMPIYPAALQGSVSRAGRTTVPRTRDVSGTS
jgi:hypothetical protein